MDYSDRNSTDGPSAATWLSAFLLVIITVLVVGSGIVAVQGQPGEPKSFFGAIEEADGTPAPEGVELFAIVDGSVEDSINVSPAGQYGGDGAFDDKLTVNTGAGDEVVFRVFSPEGPEASETAEFDTIDDEVVEFNLTFDDGTFEAQTLASVDLTLDETTIEVGETTQPTVIAEFENGLTKDVTDEAAIESTDSAVATVDGTTISGNSDGTATVSATVTDDGITESDTAGLTVDPSEDENNGGGGGSDGGDGGDGGGGGSDGGDGGDEDTEDNNNQNGNTGTDEAELPPSEELSDEEIGQEIDNLPEDRDPIQAERASTVVNEETNTATAGFSNETTVESVSINSPVNGSVVAVEYEQEPDLTGPSPGETVSTTQIKVPEGRANSSGVITQRVSAEQLAAADAAAEDLVVQRFTNGEWQTLETTVTVETETAVRLRAETPGFSFFTTSAVSPPKAVFAATPQSPTVGEELTLDATDATDRYGEIVAYEWTVGDQTITGETATVTVGTVGDLEVTLTVENDAGERNTTSQTLTIGQSGQQDEGGSGESDTGPVFAITNVDTPDRIADDDKLETAVTVSNTGDTAGETTVTLSIDGTEQGQTTVELTPGESETVRFDLPAPTNDTVVTQEIATASETTVATTTVESSGDGGVIPGFDDDGLGPGFTILGPAIAVLVVALLAYRRR